jgi:prepilin-type N-terminal cleavage/methylation domain-containing protein
MIAWSSTIDILNAPTVAQNSPCAGNCGRRISKVESSTALRRGYTLLELLIVLAIILIVSAMAAPSLMERLRSGNVQEAAQQVSEVLAAARTYAIDTGVDYHFRFEVGGNNVIAIPAEPGETLGNSNGSDSDSADFLYRARTLSDSLVLQYSHDSKSGTETLKGPAFGNLENAGELASKNWSEPILFRFDGSSETMTFRVMDKEQRSCDVSVRGLTGAISTSGVFIMEEK